MTLSPQCIMIGGRTCAGKTSLIRKLKNEESGRFEEKEFVIFDTDSIKNLLPGYSADRACLFHEESCHIFEEASRKAISSNSNVIHELIMWDPARTLQRARHFIEAGYDIRAYYVFAPPQVAARRAIDRYATADETFSGRFVPPEAILDLQQNNEVTFDILCEFVNEWRFYDNHEARFELVASGRNDCHVSFTDDEAGFRIHTPKGITAVSADGSVVNSKGSVTAAPDRDRPYCDDDGEPIRSTGGNPVLLRNFLNDPE